MPDDRIDEPRDRERELARYKAERDEALAREAAMAEVLQVINSSPGDLATVFDAILARAHSLCGIASGALETWDGSRIRASATRGLPGPFDEIIREGYAPGPHDPHWQLLAGKPFVHIHDQTAIDEPAHRKAVELAGFRTFLAVALRKGDVLLGRIVGARQEVRPFSDKEIALLQNFAAQAVIAMENARLITETREALEQQTATAEVLGVINSSPGDLKPVFEVMLEKALRLCEAEIGTFWAFDGEHSNVVANRGAPSAYAEFLRRGPHPPMPRAASIVQVADVREMEAYRDGMTLARAAADLGGVRTMLVVPLRKDDRAVGRFSVYRTEVRPFTDKQIALLQNFAAQAVIAMENARLIAETREALEQQTATAEVLGVINASPGDLAPVFDAMLEKALTLCEAAFGTLGTFDGERTQALAIRGVPAEFAEIIRRPHRPDPDTPLMRMLRGELPLVHLVDVKTEVAPWRSDPINKAADELGGIRTFLAVPLRKDEVVQGAITAYRREVRPFTDKQIALLQNFAGQAVIAMENARLITETREALEQQTASAEVLGVINSSPGNLGPVFDAILEKAHSLCDSGHGVLYLRDDDDNFNAVAMRGVPNGLAERLRRGFRGSDAPASRPLLAGDPFVHLHDMAKIAHPLAKAAAQSGARTLLSVPLRHESTLLGMIVATRFEIRPFTDKQIALLQNFAAQAVIAMENARLMTETREALEQQTATAEVLGVINSSPGDLAPVFDAILEKAHTLCEASIGSLALFDGTHFHAVAVHGSTGPFADRLRQGIAVEDAPALQQLVGGAPFLQINDLVEELDYAVSRSEVEQTRTRTILWVPLRKDGELLGQIVAARQEVRPFTDKQIALLQNFAAQAVIAIENARLIIETREALEQQTATAEVLGVINSSPGDLAPVFEAMLDKAIRLCEAACGQLMIYDGERFSPAAVEGELRAVEWLRQRGPARPGPGTTMERIVRGENLVHIADATEDDAYQQGEPSRRAFVEIGGCRTLLSIALRKDDALLGAISVYRQEVRPFTNKQIALLKNFAEQAVIAMENARLITETREALEQQTATAEVLGVINASPGDLAPVFDAILDKAMELCGAAFGHLLIWDGEYVNRAAARGASPDEAQLRRYKPNPGALFDRVLRGENVICVADLREEEAYRIGSPGARTLVDRGGARSYAYVALRKDEELLGGIAIYRTEVRPFSDKQIALLQNFAAQAVIAMENARLITETREALEQQTATAEVLGVINASPGDLAPVFKAMLDKAMRLCEAAFGTLWTLAGDRFRPVAEHGVPERYAEYLKGDVPSAGLGTGRSRLLAGERHVHILDLADEEPYRQGEPHRLALVDLGGARTALLVPLRKDDAVIGFIMIYRQEVRPFTDKQIALLQNFAAQAVIAIENARLLGELRDRNDEIAGWNKQLQARVATQLAEIERSGKLRRFLSPQLADLIVAQGDDKILESHRREIVVVFCDLRGFTGFAERAEPEEVMALLRDYHAAMGPIVASFEGTIDHYSGDGIMVFFNDPLPTPDPARRAINMAVAMRDAAQGLLLTWRGHGHDLGFGVGISQGYATLGQIGFAERMDYTAIGTVTNLAARLCDEAKDGQILISRRVATAVQDVAALEEIGDVSLKGLSQAVAVFNVASEAVSPD